MSLVVGMGSALCGDVGSLAIVVGVGEVVGRRWNWDKKCFYNHQNDVILML